MNSEERLRTIVDYLKEPIDTTIFPARYATIIADETSNEWQEGSSYNFKERFPAIIKDRNFFIRMIDSDFDFPSDEPFIGELVLNQLSVYKDRPENITDSKQRDCVLALYDKIQGLA